MPGRKPVIEDMVVVAAVTSGNPVGEALRKNDPIPIVPMTALERQAMVGRLDVSIKELMDNANAKYQASNKIPGTTDVDPDYITRLSTNEFFFYTKEPLTLKEFEDLQTEIAKKAETLPPGVQLILGSFAVKTDDDKVMNVTPHITCGQPPNFKFIVKNNTSTVDVRYKVPGVGNTLPVLDANSPSNPMPKITVNGVSMALTFYNLVASKTTGGTPFITALDICLDHNYRVAQRNYESLVKANPGILKHPVSHVVVSNTINVNKQYCVGPSVMHADPKHSLTGCKTGVAQQPGALQKLAFGNDEFRIFNVHKEVLFHIEHSYAHRTFDPAVGRDHSYKASIDTANFQGKDQTTANFINFKNKYQAFNGDHLKTVILEDFKSKIQETSSKAELEALKAELKSSHGYDVLKTGQGWFTRVTGIETTSVKALDKMFKDQEKDLEASTDLAKKPSI